MVSPSEKLIHMVRIRTRRRIPSQHREIRCYLPVKQCNLFQLRVTQLRNPALIQLRQQPLQPLPVRSPLANPAV